MYNYSEVFEVPTPGLAQLPPAVNVAVYPGFQTSIDSPQLQNWIKGEAQQDALRSCAVLKQEYLSGAFHDWFIDYGGGKIDNGNPDAPPPQPPFGAMAQMQPGNVSWDLVQTGPPVCEVPAYTKISAPQTVDHAGDMLKVLGGSSPFTKATRLGSQVTAPDGSVWARLLILLIVASAFIVPAARAQATAGCSPQPMAATKSIAEKTMGQWACWITNDGVAAYTLTPSKFYQALTTKIAPVSPNVAQQIIMDSINHLPQSRLVKVGQISLALAGVAASLYTGNAQWGLIGGLAAQNGPRAIQIIANEIPSSAPFLGGQLVAPVTIPPGGDIPPVVVYAVKVKAANLAAFVVKL